MDWRRIDFQSFTQEALIRIKPTVLAPALWLAAVIGLIFLGATAIFYMQGAIILAYLSFVIAAFPAIVAVLAFIYFAFKDPDRLQSEEFLIRREALTIIGQKGKDFKLNPINLEDMINPNSRQDKQKLESPFSGENRSLPASRSKEIEQTVDSMSEEGASRAKE